MLKNIKNTEELNLSRVLRQFGNNINAVFLSGKPITTDFGCSRSPALGVLLMKSDKIPNQTKQN